MAVVAVPAICPRSLIPSAVVDGPPSAPTDWSPPVGIHRYPWPDWELIATWPKSLIAMPRPLMPRSSMPPLGVHR